MTALHDAHGILDAAQNLQREVGASRTWTGAGLWCAFALQSKVGCREKVSSWLLRLSNCAGSPLLSRSLKPASVLVSTAAPLAVLS